MLTVCSRLAQFVKHPKITRILSYILALYAFGPTLYSQSLNVWNKVCRYASTTISVSSGDDLFDPFLRFLAARKTYNWETSFRLLSHLRHSRITQIGRKKAKIPKIGSIFNKHGHEYDPNGGNHFFFYKRRLMILDKNFGTFERDGRILLTCLGGRKPIDEMLDEVMATYKMDKQLYTMVRRPQGGHSWGHASEKPQRALSTVNLDANQKEKLLADMDDYVGGRAAKWYADRGIPYRRGYLFHGPPGTGKSSFAMALAARYQCDIYMLSILDRNMYDSNLLNLFNSLPPRALVLLEDIDSAGLNRELIRDNDRDREPATQVTLSGLLNAIDGVDSPEGHILIMTSNDPDSLDEALVRSGRVSVKVEFRKATPAQSRDIFLRMYQDDVDDPDLNLTKETIDRLASEFAGKLPDNEFSPADLQDYMLMRKSQPQRAVDELPEFVEKELQERAEEAEAARKEKEEKEQEEEKKHRRAKLRVLKDSPDEVFDESYYSHSGRISDEDL